MLQLPISRLVNTLSGVTEIWFVLEAIEQKKKLIKEEDGRS
jgi:hypothetical protein